MLWDKNRSNSQINHRPKLYHKTCIEENNMIAPYWSQRLTYIFSLSTQKSFVWWKLWYFTVEETHWKGKKQTDDQSVKYLSSYGVSSRLENGSTLCWLSRNLWRVEKCCDDLVYIIDWKCIQLHLIYKNHNPAWKLCPLPALL